jgi:hypothetical protein
MTDRVARVLHALSDNKERHTTAVCLLTECSLNQLQEMADAGVLRLSEPLNGGKRVQITTKGLESLVQIKKAQGAFPA